ncbi:hypothetical protein JR316_0013183 [Psilocybe cubensis]|uniref:Uncharacterized protein n=1 Tax=Psilocybe cubensis TaxID=181762 RepID=A0ACB8GGN8_PSICU|nr:hypothetical protein JR316_0013183 [Psilocybe cubensis]KAH9474718.1 hypothetical protein JR316_0013183 [Psilocybe cubensis]
MKVLKDLILLVRHAEIEAEKESATTNQVLAQDESVFPQKEEPVHITSDTPLVDDLQEGIWENEDSSETKGPVPRLLPRHPKYDSAGNKFLTVVDVSGFHHIPVVWCSCEERPHSETHEMQLLDLKLYPASYTDINTVFTFEVLNDHRLDNLECKSSSYQYHQKLRRKTSFAFTDYVPNRYAELCRVSRQWRNIKTRKWFGHIDDSKPERGSLALFCPTCPQPGINLPENWREEATKNPYLFTRSVTADGNFKADHLQQRNSADDVWLTDGESFMTNNQRYKRHLDTAIEIKEPPTCNKFRAENNAERAHNGCDVTGVGGHACARHGCFAPGSMVDFQKGERQMNIDWSLCEMLQTTNIDETQKLLHIYDLGCTYLQNLEKRIAANPFLTKPDKLEIIRAIGLFHVHGHQDQCLYRYATNYVPGSGVVDGEILETLWAVLNLVSRSTRTASLAHRTEVLNDHMGDSNFKKMVNIVSSIVSKYRRAVKYAAESSKYFSEITKITPVDAREEWLHTITACEERRQQNIAEMDYMRSTVQTGATLQEIETKLIKEDIETLTPGADGTTAWLVSGLKIEEAQIDLQQHVRRLGKSPTSAQELDLAKKRQRLASRIRAFHNLSGRYLGEATVLQHSQKSDIIIFPDGNISDSDFPDAPPPRSVDIENNKLVFPSVVESSDSVVLSNLKSREFELRQGQANDSLQKDGDNIISALKVLGWGSLA